MREIDELPARQLLTTGSNRPYDSAAEPSKRVRTAAFCIMC